MKKIKLCVCDWDGTVVDSIKQITACKQFLAKKHDLPLPLEEVIRSVIGLSFEKAMKICFPTATLSERRNIASEFHQLMTLPQYQSLPFDRAIEVLEQLKQRDLFLAIATSKSSTELKSALSYLRLEKMFDVVCCGENYRNKPDPAMLNYIMQLTNVAAEETVMIGDTIYDMQFARNAGVNAIAVEFGSHSLDKLLEYRPIKTISTWSDILSLF